MTMVPVAFLSPLAIRNSFHSNNPTKSLRTSTYNHISTPAHRMILKSQANTSTEIDPIAENPLGAPKILCVGEALYDLFSEDPNASLSDETSWKPYPGGAPANLACGLANLGTASAFIGTLGSDERGKELRQLFLERNVNIDGIICSDKLPTRCVHVRRDSTGERSFVGFLGNASANSFADAAPLDTDLVPGVLFYAAQILVSPTLGLAFPGSRKALNDLVNIARECQLTILVDVNWRQVFWKGIAEEDARNIILEFVSNADWVKLSTEEVGFLFDKQLEETALENPSKIREKLGGRVNGVIVTGGKDGASYSFNVGMNAVEGRVDAVIPEHVVDTTGAGDAFLAGFLSEMFAQGGPLALGNKDKVERMAQFASLVASVVIQRPGCIEPQPTRAAVQAAMKKMT